MTPAEVNDNDDAAKCGFCVDGYVGRHDVCGKCSRTQGDTADKDWVPGYSGCGDQWIDGYWLDNDDVGDDDADDKEAVAAYEAASAAADAAVETASNAVVNAAAEAIHYNLGAAAAATPIL